MAENNAVPAGSQQGGRQDKDTERQSKQSGGEIRRNNGGRNGNRRRRSGGRQEQRREIEPAARKDGKEIKESKDSKDFKGGKGGRKNRDFKGKKDNREFRGDRDNARREQGEHDSKFSNRNQSRRKPEKHLTPEEERLMEEQTRKVETIDDIRSDNARITKEIYLEIASMKNINLN